MTKTARSPKTTDAVKIVFLDFDGVINSYHDNRFFPGHEMSVLDPQRIGYVQRICDRTGAKVVLSTAWREHFDMKTLKRFLRRRGLKAEVIGRTPSYDGVDRGFEVEGWLRKTSLKVESFVCLDDLDEFRMMREHHVHTDPLKGLEPRHIAEACRILSKVVSLD